MSSSSNLDVSPDGRLVAVQQLLCGVLPVCVSFLFHAEYSIKKKSNNNNDDNNNNPG